MFAPVLCCSCQAFSGNRRGARQIVPAWEVSFLTLSRQVLVLLKWPRYITYARELAGIATWLFRCFAFFFIVLAESGDLVGVGFSRFNSVGPAVFSARVLCLLSRVCRHLVVFPSCVCCLWLLGSWRRDGFVAFVPAPATGHVCVALSAHFAIHWQLLRCDVGILHFVANHAKMLGIGRRLRRDVGFSLCTSRWVDTGKNLAPSWRGSLCFVLNSRCMEVGSVVAWVSVLRDELSLHGR